MFDTYVTVVGNVLTRPEWRRISADVMVANFKVASTARRLDKDNGRWVDGNSLRVRVACWRRLAENVVASVAVGDPVIVAGRLYTRDWVDPEGNHRSLYELDAATVGHDLSRGRAKFARFNPAKSTSTVEDAEADGRVQGRPTEPVPDDQAPVRPGEGLPEIDPELLHAPVGPSSRDETTTGAGLDFDPFAGLGDDPADPFADGDSGPSGDQEAPGDDSRRPGDEPGAPVDDPVDQPVEEPQQPSRSRRGRSREAVPV